MATTHLRHAFKYPDEDNTSEPAGIDEEEQEKLIAKLRDDDIDTSLQYRDIFLILLLLVGLPFLFQLIISPSITSLLTSSSLVATGYVIYLMPVPSDASNPGRHIVRIPEQLPPGPLQRYLVPLNGMLAAVLALTGFLKARKEGASQDGVYALLPLVMFVAVLIVRSQLRPVDVDELAKLRYNYKGA